MMKKKILSGLLSLALVLTSLVSCTQEDTSGKESSSQIEESQSTSVEESTPEATPEESDAAEGGGARIYVDGDKFMVGDREIWINGVNTPWDNWNDFGGKMDGKFWTDEFAELHENGINATRIWITCNGDVGITIDENGYVTGATDSHWKHLDYLFSYAEQYHIYIMATLISFDHFKDTNQTHMSWRAMVQDEAKIDSYVENYLIPFCERYGDCEYLWSIDLCNEPDWVYENGECGRISWEHLNNYFAKCAAAIHENSKILVTIGYGMVKYCSDKYNANYSTDKYLQSRYSDKNAYLDFYSPHFYGWQASWMGIPFEMTPKQFGLDSSKPCLFGEMPANALTVKDGGKDMDLTACYLGAYENGWKGIMPWTSNGVDACGDMTQIAPASAAILEKIESLIFPLNDRDLQKK